MYNIYIYLSTYIHFGLESLESFHFFWTQVCLTLNLERQAVALLRPRTKRQGIWVAVTLLWGSCGFWLQNLHSSFSEHLTLVWKRLTKLAFRSSFLKTSDRLFLSFSFTLCVKVQIFGDFHLPRWTFCDGMAWVGQKKIQESSSLMVQRWEIKPLNHIKPY